MVPFHSVGTVGMRRVVKNGEIQKVVDFLSDGECDNMPTGKTALRKIPTACEPALCWKWLRF